MTVTVSYDTDVVAWANEQAALIRAGRFDQLDIAHIAEEIEDVGKSEQRELTSPMAVLLAHLLKWQFQPERQGKSWLLTMRAQRADIRYVLDEAPSLRNKLAEPAWVDVVWKRAVAQAATETGLVNFPEQCEWSMNDALTDGWLPPTSPKP